MEKIEIYYVDNKEKFRKNVENCIDYIINYLRKDFNFITYSDETTEETIINKILDKDIIQNFVKNKVYTFPNNVKMYRISIDKKLNNTVDIVFLYLTQPVEINSIIKNAEKNFKYIYAPYTEKELNDMKNNPKYEMIELKINK